MDKYKRRKGIGLPPCNWQRLYSHLKLLMARLPKPTCLKPDYVIDFIHAVKYAVRDIKPPEITVCHLNMDEVALTRIFLTYFGKRKESGSDAPKVLSRIIKVVWRLHAREPKTYRLDDHN